MAHIAFSASGGVTGVRLRWEGDTADLGAAGRELDALIADADLAAAPAAPAGRRTRPDVTSYRLRVDEGDRTVDANFDDLTAPPRVRPLLRRLQSLALTGDADAGDPS